MFHPFLGMLFSAIQHELDVRCSLLAYGRHDFLLLPLDEFEKANWRNEGAQDKEVWSLAFCE